MKDKKPHADPYDTRVQELEAKGMSHEEACDAVDLEFGLEPPKLKRPHICDEAKRCRDQQHEENLKANRAYVTKMKMLKILED